MQGMQTSSSAHGSAHPHNMISEWLTRAPAKEQCLRGNALNNYAVIQHLVWLARPPHINAQRRGRVANMCSDPAPDRNR